MAKLDVRVYPFTNQDSNSTRAFASLAVEDLIAIKGIRVVEGAKGLFVTMPQSRDQDGNYHDIAFPLTSDLRKAVNKAILDEYQAVTAEKSAEHSAALEESAIPSVPKRSEPDEFEL